MADLKKTKNTCDHQKPSIVFDLDETLVHLIKGKHPNSISIKVNEQIKNILVRKGASLLLSELYQLYELFIFTSSKKEYADPIIEKIAPFIPMENRFYQSSIRFCAKHAFKDLKLINRNISRTILVDNCSQNAALQPRNVIVIKKFIGDDSDSVLTDDLLPLLISIANDENLPKSIRRHALIRPTKNLWFYSK